MSLYSGLGFLGLWLMSLCCFVPWLKGLRYGRVIIIMIWTILSFGLYEYLGSSAEVKAYQNRRAKSSDLNRSHLQHRLVEFRKIEMLYRLQLERDPDNALVQWQLEDVVANQALYQGSFDEALIHWKAALSIIDRHQSSQWEADRLRIQTYMITLQALKNQ